MTWWHLFRDHQRRAALVHAELVTHRCERCGATLGDWDGRFLPGDVHFEDGGYLLRIFVHCPGCQAEQVFYVSWECRRTERLFEDNLACRLYNRDRLLSGLFPESRNAFHA